MLECADVLIVGASAAGMTAAVFAKKASRNANVVILERNKKVGKKLLVTGNGRCNLTNSNMDSSHFKGDKGFVRDILEQFSYGDTLKFFTYMGVDLIELDEGRIYPRTLQSNTILDAMRMELDLLGVNIITETLVSAISKEGENFSLITDKGKFLASKVILACGGSALPSSGSDGSGIRLAVSLGIRSSAVFPALAPVFSNDSILRSLKGIRCMAKATLFANNQIIESEIGQVQFIENGLSGICVMQLARSVNSLKTRRLKIELDLLPHKLKDEVRLYLQNQRYRLGSKTIENLLTGLLNRRLAQAVLKKAGVLPLSRGCQTLDKEEIETITETLKHFCVAVERSFPFKDAQVTAGGLSLSEFDSKTMHSKNIEGLFACGEILDVDGDCGGYNLQWAFSSGSVAGKSVAATMQP